MKSFICATCGVQYPPSESVPEHCPICEDERQYLPVTGQRWLNYSEVSSTYENLCLEEEPGLLLVASEPRVGIGQCARIIHTPHGNVMWECTPVLTSETRRRITALGGIQAFALSHPHFQSTIVEWSMAFDNAPIFIHEADRQWIQRDMANMRYWHGEQHVLCDGMTLINCGGHFDGSTVLHWRDGAAGAGALFTGDTITVVQDHRWVSFMRSYPNLIPLSARKIRKIVSRVHGLQFDRLYSSWIGEIVTNDAHAAVIRSADRYIQAITD